VQGIRTPCTSPAARSTSRRRALPGAPVPRAWRVCVAPRGRGGLRAPGTPRRRRRRWPLVKSRWGEVVQLHPIVVAQPTHKAPRQCGEATLMTPDEADHVAERWVRLPICRRRSNPHRGRSLHVRRQQPTVYKLAQGKLRHRRTAPWQWVQYRDWLGWGHCSWLRHAKTMRAADKEQGGERPENKGEEREAADAKC
jgi:hypothetical protein